MTATATPHLTLGLPADAEQLHRQLHHEVRRLLDVGIRVPCVEQAELFHSDGFAERRIAAGMCRSWCCPVLGLCADYADAAGERLGVWGGQDRQTPRGRRPEAVVS